MPTSAGYGALSAALLCAALPAAARGYIDAAPLSDGVPDGGYGGLGHGRRGAYASAGFGAGYARDAESPAAAVEALMSRVGLTPADFTVSAIPSAASGLDTMQLGSAGGKVLIKGSSGVAMASALNWYLNDWCNTTYDWNTYHLTLPSKLPLPPAAGTEVRARAVKWGYYMNVCTMGYSLVFTDWAYWEKQIDWMALNGINLPLAFVGQEWVWAEVFKDYGLQFSDLDTFFTGPAFLPWYRMGNIRGWAGGDMNNAAEEHFTQRRGTFQKELLARMRGLGMTAVLSAFSGHVPKAFVDMHPAAKIRRSPNWGRMPTDYNTATIAHANYASVYMLDPHDPLFSELGNKFVAKMAAEWGTDHVYQTDTYNEMAPSENDTAFLHASSAAVLGAMTVADPDAIWLMQGWLFHESFWGDAQMKAYLGGVPKEKMWVLDLNSQASPIYTRNNGDGLYGHPYIWCTLNTYGGQNGLYGPDVGKEIFGTDGTAGVHAALNQGSTITGVGLTMEGIWTNYPVFETTLLLGWEGGHTDGCSKGGSVSKCNASQAGYWTHYGTRRYGAETAGGVAAWEMLGATIYGAGPRGSRLGPIEYVPVLSKEDEELPVTLQLHPELLADARVVEEYTWHLGSSPGELRARHAHKMALQYGVPLSGAAGSNASSASACEWVEKPSTYLAFEAPGTPGPQKTLAAAQAWCCAHAKCGGVTKNIHGAYEPRYHSQACASPAHETSWVKTGAATPHGCVAPGGSGSEPEGAICAKAWALLLGEKARLSSVPQYRYDLIDLGRQSLEVNFSAAAVRFKAAAAAKDLANATERADALLVMLDDYDALLSSNANFMLGPWIGWARSWSNQTDEQAWLEFNARNQITLWGPTGQINDYAAKAWGGLVSTYYKPRWALFTKAVLASLAPGGTPYSQAAFGAAWMAQIGLPWSNSTAPVPAEPVGDTVEIAARLYRKYVGPISDM